MIKKINMKPTFITPIAMECTQEQYEKDLKQPLESLGYKEKDLNTESGRYNILCTKFTCNTGTLGFIDKTCFNEYQIKNYNPKLFLALAAMTEGDEPIVGEWMYLLDEDLGKVGTLFEVKKIGTGIVNCKEGVIGLSLVGSCYRKATKEEIIKHFTNQNKETMKLTHVTFTPSQQREVYQMACLTWKPVIQKVFADSLFNDENYELPTETFKEWLEASTSEQLSVFKKMQPEYFKENEKTYSVGMRFKYKRGNEYILAQINSREVILINLKDGNRWTAAAKIKNYLSITQEEFETIANGDMKDFTLI